MTFSPIQKPLFCYSRAQSPINNGGGSGWKKEGMEMFKKLCFDVRKNRKVADPKFNEELLKLYRERRQRGRSGRDDRMATRKRKKDTPSRCFDEFNDPDSDDDEQAGQDDRQQHDGSGPLCGTATFAYQNTKENNIASTRSQGSYSHDSYHDYLLQYKGVVVKQEKV